MPFFLISIGFVASIYAQDSYDEKIYNSSILDMFQCTNAETSLFTGRLNYSVPIYNLSDSDFDLNISIRYNSDGFKPRKNSGYVGLNWFLDAGGCIIREKNGLADECNYISHGDSANIGMLEYAKIHPLKSSDVYNFEDSIYCQYNYNFTICGENETDNIDYLPDIFHFNFCGYSGAFIINNKGNAVILNGDYVNVDLSGINTIDTLHTLICPQPKLPSSIILTTTDGYQYKFGGDITSVEYNLSVDSQLNFYLQQTPAISTWHLTEITAPNKRKITFFYKSIHDITQKDSIWVVNQYFNKFDHSTSQTKVKYNVTKECILDSISVSGQERLSIRFVNSISEHRLIGKKNDFYNHQLDCVLVHTATDTLKLIAITYEYKSDPNNNYYWRFLKSIHTIGFGKYQFLYNHTSTYPSLNDNINSQANDIVDIYEYWKTNQQQGILKEVILPTSGKQKFFYERNDYSTERRYVNNNGYSIALVSLDTTNIISSGMRISHIETYDEENNLIEKKQYLYNKIGQNKSSGIYYNRILIYYAHRPDYGEMIVDGHNYNLIDTHIGYSCVTENTTHYPTQTITKKRYHYSVGRNYFNLAQSTNIHPNSSLPNASCNSVYSNISGMLAFDNMISPLGKLLSVQYYTNDELICTDSIEYNGVHNGNPAIMPNDIIPLTCTDTIAIFSPWYAYITRQLFIFPDFINRISHKTYRNHQPLQQITTYIHDTKFRIRREEKKNSDNIIYYTKYSYPDDYNTTNIYEPHTRAINNLITAHRIAQPIETISGYIDADDTIITAAKLNVYKAHDYVIHNPHPLYAPPIDQFNYIVEYTALDYSMSLDFQSIGINDFQPFFVNGANINYDSRYSLDCEYKYNNQLQLTRLKPYGKAETIYTWNGIYLTSKTIGNQIWHYTYIPYVGISSITNPLGITTYYSYNTNGKLVEEYRMNNGKKEILNYYHYHISSEQ